MRIPAQLLEKPPQQKTAPQLDPVILRVITDRNGNESGYVMDGHYYPREILCQEVASAFYLDAYNIQTDTHDRTKELCFKVDVAGAHMMLQPEQVLKRVMEARERRGVTPSIEIDENIIDIIMESPDIRICDDNNAIGLKYNPSKQEFVSPVHEPEVAKAKSSARKPSQAVTAAAVALPTPSIDFKPIAAAATKATAKAAILFK